jgi:AcrR family transcriptional regulator
MARRAGAKKSRSKPAAGQVADAKDRMVDAALALAARQGWRRTGLAEIAAEAGLPLAEAYAACPSKLALLAALHRRIDRAALAASGETTEPQRDRLFDLLMRRFDALAPHRAALRAILRDSWGDPGALFAAPALIGSMQWMLEAAGAGSGGWTTRFRAHILAAIYISVFRAFLRDDSEDLAKTMAELDRRLRAAESWLGLNAPREPG